MRKRNLEILPLRMEAGEVEGVGGKEKGGQLDLS